MQLNRRKFGAVLTIISIVGTAFFITTPSTLHARSPIKNFYLTPSPYSASIHTLALFNIDLNNLYDMDIEIRVYTKTGKLVRTIAQADVPQGTITQITWLGVNDQGKKIVPGGYICKMIATPSQGKGNKYSKSISFGVLP